MTEMTISHPPVKRPWTLLGAGAVFGLLLVIGVAWLFGNVFRPYTFHGMLLQSPVKATDFTLTGHNSQLVSLSDYRDKIVLLYFGYVTCPDVCPATLAELHKARLALGKRADQVQVIMISVDPDRDTVAILADYIPQFDSSFIALTGSPEQIAQVATYYGIFYEKQTGDSALGYVVDHTATVLAIDRQGYLRVVFPFGAPAADITADLEYLLKR